MDLSGAGGTQGGSKLTRRGAGGDNVINNGNAGIAQLWVCAGWYGECVAHIGSTGTDIEGLLAGGGARALGDGRTHWPLQAVAEMGCEQCALVVTPLPLAAPVQWNRY